MDKHRLRSVGDRISLASSISADNNAQAPVDWRRERDHPLSALDLASSPPSSSRASCLAPPTTALAAHTPHPSSASRSATPTLF